MTELQVAIAQMISIDDVALNLKQMKSLIDVAFAMGKPRLICFPENCLYLRLVEGQKISGFNTHDAVFVELASIAKERSVYMHLGSVPLIVDDKLFNSSILISPEGVVTPTYRKIHLFDIQLEGQKPLRESDVFQHGATPNTINIDSWKIGEAICYDVRFSELFNFYARQEVDAILLPAAFLQKTGEAHWEILLRARAIESQAYVIASAQGGHHIGVSGGLRDTFGHSLVSDPWGRLLARQEKPEIGVELVTLQKDELAKVRRQIPMMSHRRL